MSAELLNSRVEALPGFLSRPDTSEAHLSPAFQEGINQQAIENKKYGVLSYAKECKNNNGKFGVQYLGDGLAGCDVAEPYGDAVEKVDLCRIDPHTNLVTRYRLQMDPYKMIATGFVPGLVPGDRYFFRAGKKETSLSPYVDYDNEIIDPYARSIEGDVVYAPNGQQIRPRCIVVPQSTDRVKPLVRENKPLKEVVYECHVQGTTGKSPRVPENQRGTYAGLKHESIIEHLKSLHVTAAQIMPVHQFHANQRFLAEKGLKNYWGYNTIGFFAPHAEYSSDKKPNGQVTEFKDMVSAYHEAGIEVILDVVYNHTGEDPISKLNMLFNGLGIEDFYHTSTENGTQSFANWTGCGNTINTGNDVALNTIMDSLEYWAEEMGVDGFRFDLTPPLVREGYNGKDINVNGKFMQALMTFKNSFKDRTGRELKIIFEPWADGMCDPQAFSPYGHAQSKLFRDQSRLFPRGYADLSKVATIISGAHIPLVDVAYEPVNFVTCHDGFTMHDLVSRNIPENVWPDGTPDGDGERNNNSYNWGVEGDTDDPLILEKRYRAKRVMVTLLALSGGIAMISHGDELSCDQKGNNNAYNQANELTMRNWELDEYKTKFLEYFKGVFGMIAETPTLCDKAGHKWLRADGAIMGDDDWNHHYVAGLSLVGKDGGDKMIVYLNKGYNKVEVTAPDDGEYDIAIDPNKEFIGRTDDFGDLVLDSDTGMLKFSQRHKLGQNFTIDPGSIIVARRVSHSIRKNAVNETA